MGGGRGGGGGGDVKVELGEGAEKSSVVDYALLNKDYMVKKDIARKKDSWSQITLISIQIAFRSMIFPEKTVWNKKAHVQHVKNAI